MSSPPKVLAVIATLTCYGLHEKLGSSWLFAIPIWLGFFLVWGCYRMFIYERYINPLSQLPGPKVHPSPFLINIRDIGFLGSFPLFCRRNRVKHIAVGLRNTVTQRVSFRSRESSIPDSSLLHLVLQFSTFSIAVVT